MGKASFDGMKKLKPSDLYDFAYQALQGKVSESELKGVVRVFVEEFFQFGLNIKVLDTPQEIDPSQWQQFLNGLDRLSRQEPWQHVLGYAWFFGRKFLVSPDVLIPRPETEELVDLILKSKQGPCRLLDIGTGSGCIPVTIQLERPHWHISALDISSKALEIARQNAAQFDLPINFMAMDILSDLPQGSWDVIVSNPPYVKQKEAELMEANVLDYEPHLALFVPDHDPLFFYRRIADIASQVLVPGGLLFFEINEFHGQEMYALLAEYDFLEISLMQDMQGKDRMMRALKA